MLKFKLPWKQPKIFVLQKVKVQLVTIHSPNGSRNFTQVARTSTIRQSQVDLKPWILSQCYKYQRVSGELNQCYKYQRVSGELGISQSTMVCYLHDLSKSIQSCCIEPHVTKFCKTSDSP